MIIALVAGAVLLILITGAAVVGFRLVQDGGDAEPGPVDLRQPLLLQQVAQTQPPPCPAGMLREMDGSAFYRLEPGGMTVQRLEDIRLLVPGAQSSQWGVTLKLTPADAALFGDLTGRAHTAGTGNPGNRIAMVAGGVILSAPTVTAPITAGEVQITGQFDRTEAERLIQRMTGRPPS